nr:MAG TPA: hypothetical protein [Caudoviricetes sp.]
MPVPWPSASMISPSSSTVRSKRLRTSSVVMLRLLIRVRPIFSRASLIVIVVTSKFIFVIALSLCTGFLRAIKYLALSAPGMRRSSRGSAHLVWCRGTSQ